MRYAKLINNYPSYAPRRIRIGDAWVYNPTGEQLLAEGYLPVSETEPPETDAQHYAFGKSGAKTQGRHIHETAICYAGLPASSSPLSTLNSSLYKRYLFDLPRDQHRFFVHGDEAEVFSREADAAFLQGDHDLVRAVSLQAAVLLDEHLPVAGEREPRQTVQTEGRDLQPLRREIDDIRDAAHKTTSGA